jgi:hypothetical protein
MEIENENTGENDINNDTENEQSSEAPGQDSSEDNDAFENANENDESDENEAPEDEELQETSQEESRQKELQNQYRNNAALQRELLKARSNLEKYRAATGQYGFTGDDDDRTDQMLAHKLGKSVDEIRAERSARAAAFNAVLRNHPLIKQLENEKAERRFSDDLAKIKAVFPDEGANHVKELGDRFMSLMATGKVDAVTAYKAVNGDKIAEGSARRAAQRAYDSMSGKEHLRSSGGSVGAYYPVPKDVYEMYKKLNPRATDKQIKEHYNRSKRG